MGYRSKKKPQTIKRRKTKERKIRKIRKTRDDERERKNWKRGGTKRQPKKRHQKKGTRKVKGFRQLSCSPDKKLAYTCYDEQSLEKIKESWNDTHKEEKIVTNDTRDIWTSLKTNLADRCDTEKCWLNQKFMEKKLDSKLLKNTFAPQAPKSWQQNPNEWLDSDNIIQVMRQYEHTYPDFKFIGPSPIDFDTKESFSQCVWPELCNFSVKEHLDKGKTKIGMIFNTDPHTKGGSHWISTFIDFKMRYIFYFDSNADKTPKQVLALVKRIKDQALALKEPIVFKMWKNVVEHQRSNTECGVYSLYTIIKLLTRKKQLKDFDTRIPDSVMEDARTLFFNT